MAEETARAPVAEPTTKPKKKTKRRRKPATTFPPALMSKADAVRAALKAGAKKPAEGVAYVKEKFGIEIGGQMFSAYKSQFATRRAVRKAQKVANGGIVNNGQSRTSSAVGYGKVIDLLVEVRKLNDEYGPETVAKVVQVLG